MQMHLLDYIANIESYADPITERAFDVVYFLHDRGFINLADWVFTWPSDENTSDFKSQDVSILDHDIRIISKCEGHLDLKIVCDSKTIFDATLIYDDLEVGYLDRRVVSHDCSLDPLLVLIKMHDPVDG